MRDIVIVGAGLAGHRAAGALRRAGHEGRVIVVGEEAHRPYDRPPLSKQLLDGAVDRAELYYPVDDLDLEWVLGTPATGLDTAAREITVGTGDAARRVGYDGLVLATGRGARDWPEPVGPAGVHRLRTLDESQAFRDAAFTGGRVVIAGAGFVGCEVAATLRTHGVEVTVVDVADQPLVPLGPAVGAWMARAHRARGVDLRTSTGIASFADADGAVTGAELTDGTRVDARLVLLALGSAPSTGWLAGSGLVLDDAGNVVCDRHLFAEGADDVVVAGDVAAVPHPRTGRPHGVEHWSHARETGETAARNLLDRAAAEPFRAVPTFWSDQYDLKIKSAGLLRDATEIEIVEEVDGERPSLVAEARFEGALVGAVAINRNRRMIDYTRRFAADLADRAVLGTA